MAEEADDDLSDKRVLSAEVGKADGGALVLRGKVGEEVKVRRSRFGLLELGGRRRLCGRLSISGLHGPS